MSLLNEIIQQMSTQAIRDLNKTEHRKTNSQRAVKVTLQSITESFGFVNSSSVT